MQIWTVIKFHLLLSIFQKRRNLVEVRTTKLKQTIV